MKLNFSDFFLFLFFVFTLSCRCLITLPSLLFMLNQTTGYSGRNTDWKLDLEDRYRLYWQLLLFTQSNLRFRVSLNNYSSLPQGGRIRPWPTTLKTKYILLYCSRGNTQGTLGMCLMYVQKWMQLQKCFHISGPKWHVFNKTLSEQKN